MQAANDEEGEGVFCGMQIAESCQRVICGKFNADFTAERR